MTNITLRWAGPSDATSASTYKIERTLDNGSWSILAAAQAATSPYASVSNTLASNTSHGATTVTLIDASSFGTSGYAWIDDALIQWTGKSSNTLTGVTWQSGYGTYASGSTVRVAHESYADSGVTITANTVLYRITHTLSGTDSAPLYVWFYDPPKATSREHCVVVVALATDMGFDLQDAITVSGALADTDQFSDLAGLHLQADASAANSQTTNSFGLAFFQCWRDSARSDVNGGADAHYTFTIDPGGAALSLTATTIPDRDWVLLSQIV